MRMKRIMSLLIATLLTMTLVVGCTNEELSFYEIQKDMSTLARVKPVHSEGEFTISIDEISDQLMGTSTDETTKEMISDVQEFFAENSFVYTMDSDTAKNKLKMDLSLSSNITDEKESLFEVIRDTDTTYVKMDGYLDMIIDIVSSLDDEVVQDEDIQEVKDELDKFFGDAEYISISDEELVDYYAGLIGETMGQQQADMIKEEFEALLDPQAQMDAIEAQYDFMDVLMKKVYNGYSSDLVEKEADGKYSMTLDADNFADTVVGFMNYSLDNSDLLLDTIESYLMNLSDEQYSMLAGAYALDTMNKEMLPDMFDELAKELSSSKEEVKLQMQQVLFLYNGIYKTYVQGSELKVTVGEDNGTYTTDTKLTLQVNDPETQTTMFKASMAYGQTIKETEPFDVKAPKDNVVTMTELLGRIPKVMTIYAGYGRYTMVDASNAKFSESGTMDIVLKDGTSYVPLRLIGEEFSETVGWDNTVNKPYIVKDGKNVYFDEYIIEDSTAYVKSRAFEAIGYTIAWDEDLGAITIQE